MKDLAKDILNSIPQYLINFYRHCGSPRQFTLTRIPKDETETKGALTEALKFMLISFVLMLMLCSGFRKPEENTYEYMIVLAITLLIQMSLFVLSIYLPWRWFGSKKSFFDYLIIYAYNFGVVVVFFIFSFIITAGYIKTNDPTGFKMLYDTDPKIVAEAYERQHMIIGGFILIISLAFTVAWSWIAWGAYRIMNNVGSMKSFFISIIASTLSIFVLYFSNMLTNGVFVKIP